MKILFLFALLIELLFGNIYNTDIRPKDYNQSKYPHIKILDQKNIDISQIGSVHFAEASDLAYDDKRHLLYMVGDKGYLYSFDINLTDKIESIKPKNGYLLVKQNGKHFKHKVDSEGLTLDKENGTLLISFERKPKIAIFDTTGKQQAKLKLPKALNDKHRYEDANKMLESVALHPKYGVLSAAEYPLKGSAKGIQSIYSLSGKKWDFKSEPDPKDGITALEVMDDGNLLVLERDFRSMFRRIITLKKLYLDQKEPNGLYRSEVLLKMDTANGWNNDNFEGLTRVAPHRYLMISDNNDNMFQRTLLIYFEVLP